MPDPAAEDLVVALRIALAEAAELARARSFVSEAEAAEVVCALGSMRAADTVALAVATAHGYALAPPGRRGRPRPVRPAGRSLDAQRLVDTGVAAVLCDGGEADFDLVARQLAEHLAGPPVDIFDYAVIDVHLKLPTPVSVVGGWELVTPAQADLRAALPVPATPRRGRGWDPDFCTGLAMLRRVDPEQEPVRTSLISLDLDPPHRLWEPLLALSLYANPVIHLYARYVVEPGRHVEPLFERYSMHGMSADGEEWHEVAALGDFKVADDELSRLTAFLAAVGPLIEASQSSADKKGRKSAARVRRATEHFLTAGENAYGQGDVLSERNAETVLHYVIALEALLSAPDEQPTDLTRKVAQRAAVLAGRDDADRLAVYEFVRSAYAARSRFAHGVEAPEIPTPTLRCIVRRCLLARLLIGDPPNGYDSLARLADDALLAEDLRRARVDAPVQALLHAIDCFGGGLEDEEAGGGTEQ